MFNHDHSITLTPTRRLATHLLSQHHEIMALTARAWETPLIQSLGDFIMLLWEQLEMSDHCDDTLLSVGQSLHQWEKIIRESQRGVSLLKTYDTAKTAYAAWDLLHQWGLIASFESSAENVDQETFSNWAKSYEAWLAQHRFVDPATMTTILTEKMDLLQIPYQNVKLTAFERIPPQTEKLFDALREKGITITVIEPPKIANPKHAKVSFDNTDIEIKACAKWAITQMAAGKKKIAIIVPDLPEKRTQIEKQFQDTYDWTLNIDPEAPHCDWINFSAAIPLSQNPLIQDAILLIQCACFGGTPQQFQSALLSPFSRDFSESHMVRYDTITALKTGKSVVLPLLEDCKAFRQTLEKVQSYPTWAQHFREALRLWGWPGDRVLNSHEHQVVKRFYILLEEWGSVDLNDTMVSFNEAFKSLQDTITNCPFQPESRDAVIQVLGMLEASGQVFDCAWVLGLHRDAWPGEHHPNPFIAQSIQKQYQMPHACPEHELEYAKRVLERFKECADDIFFSFAYQDKDKPLAPSPLIVDLPFSNMDEWVEDLGSPWPNMQIDLMPWEETYGPAMVGAISGGTQVLSLQATCPFKAFAEVRLNARLIDWQPNWLEPFEKGIIFHHILEAFWQKMRDQTTLKGQSHEGLREILNNLIDKAIQKGARSNLSSLYLAVEKKRLLEILLSYCEHEKARPDFKVFATEWQGQYAIENAVFHIRIDRVDQDVSKEMVLIDYKTGAFDMNRLWDDRLENVQLPLYYLAMQNTGNTPETLMVIQLDLKAITVQGIANKDEGLTGIQSETGLLSRLGERWQQQLTTLTKEFSAGFAAVQPNKMTSTCQYCDLLAFCRRK